MKSPLVVLVFALALLDHAGCLQGRQDREWIFITLAQGTASGITEERREAIRDPAAWAAFWQAHAGPNSPPAPVNFREELVIVVHAGTRPTSGYAVVVTKVLSRDGKVAVHFEEQKPGPRCVVAPIPTHPYHVISVPTTPLAPIFVKHDRVQDC